MPQKSVKSFQWQEPDSQQQGATQPKNILY